MKFSKVKLSIRAKTQPHRDPKLLLLGYLEYYDTKAVLDEISDYIYLEKPIKSVESFHIILYGKKFSKIKLIYPKCYKNDVDRLINQIILKFSDYFIIRRCLI